MAEGAQRERWWRNSELMAMIHNTTPGLQEHQIRSPDKFNPFAVEAPDKDDIVVTGEIFRGIAKAINGGTLQ
jgi:hypothetical protein